MLKPSARNARLKCPECSKLCTGSQGLAAHKRSAHPDSFTTHPFKATRLTDRALLVPPAELPPAAPLHLLGSAISSLETELTSIKAEISRLEALRSAETLLSQQLKALLSARDTFTTVDDPLAPLALKPAK
jgi:hypothetical protein